MKKQVAKIYLKILIYKFNYYSKINVLKIGVL